MEKDDLKEPNQGVQEADPRVSAATQPTQESEPAPATLNGASAKADGNHPPSPHHHKGKDAPHKGKDAPPTSTPLTSTESPLAIGGYVFLAVSVLGFATAAIMAATHKEKPPYPSDASTQQVVVIALSFYLPELIGFVVGLVAATVGYALLRSAGKAQREVIPSNDATLLGELLKSGNKAGLEGYIELASLSGFVGFCMKLGIGGLPLATIGLTIFFTVVGAFANNSPPFFFDLAKLTLGAFIGSYVQGQQKPPKG
jgi:hypothetical protein